jgi:hypothetical protein
MENDRPLRPPRATWRIASEPDSSFDTYDDALALLVSPALPVTSRIDPGRTLVDLEFEYVVAAPDGRFSVRVNGLGLTSRPSQMETRFLTEDGDLRAFVTSGAPRRIDLEPRWQAVAGTFVRLGAEQVALTGLHVAFILCLAIPPRSLRSTLAAFGAFAAGCGFALAVSASAPGAPGAGRALFQALAGGALVVAALQNITGPQFKWVRAEAAAFGVLDGLLIGLAFRESAQFAGSHASMAIVSFAAPILAGSLWLLLVAFPILRMIHRSRLPARWAIVCLSALPIHTGLHGLLVGQ